MSELDLPAPGAGTAAGVAAAAFTGPIVPVILCGGAGSRLWPLSRRDFAKQHAVVIDEASLFQRTLARVSGPGFSGPALAITAGGSRFLVADQAGALPVTIVVEPEGRDTLAAVTAAACLVERRDPSAIALVMPSDHFIPDPEGFAQAARKAAAIAATGRIVTLGIAPTRPATGFGYIERGAPLASGAHEVARFVEKPDAAQAEALIAAGCLWNAGVFCFRADALLAEIGALQPEALARVREAVGEGTDDLGALRLGEAFRAAPKISFDHAIMERTANAAVVEAVFDWSDIGDWNALWDRSPRDAAGVATEGRVVTRDVANSYIRSDGRLVCALGVEGLAIVDTADAVLVAPLARAQEIRALVSDLEQARMPEAHTPARVHRPWGWYQTMDLGARFRVKRILVHPGKKLSLQRHFHRAEHWVVVRGTAEVQRDDERILLRENESVYLPLGCRHRLTNPGRIPVEIVEVQTGAYLEEDDIERFEDDFGRT